MKFVLSIRPEAEEDIREAYAYYQQCQTGLGDDFITAVDAALNKIIENPELYREIYSGFRRLLIGRFPLWCFLQDIRQQSVGICCNPYKQSSKDLAKAQLTRG